MQLHLINQPLRDNDEGIYLTTFLLITKNYPAYKQTFLSQPPGFLLSVYPGFIFFGKTLQAARLTIALWSLAGLIAIVYICHELKNRWAGVLALGLLYLIPIYYNQTLTFQSDALANAFSLIALAAVIRYALKQSFLWYIISVIFLNLAFWTKFDFFLIPSFLLILFINIVTIYRSSPDKSGRELTRYRLLTLRVRRINNLIKSKTFIQLSIIFGFISGLFLIFFHFLFGVQNIFGNIIGLRLAAVNASTSPFLLLSYIAQNKLLALIFTVSVLFVFFKKGSFRFPLLPITIWLGTVFTFLFFYRPLFPHHLSMLTIPVVLFFSLSITNLNFNSHVSLVKNPELAGRSKSLIVLILIIALFNYISLTIHTPYGILTPEQKQTAEIITRYTDPHDQIVTDDEILNAVTNRLPPPELSDVSYVRISSGNLRGDNFRQIISKYNPIMLIPRNGRLRSIPGFSDILANYHSLTITNEQPLYIRN
jgi:4-amino-4-deoxy-L-arabinose transferase-like glycosyltransferase